MNCGGDKTKVKFKLYDGMLYCEAKDLIHNYDTTLKTIIPTNGMLTFTQRGIHSCINLSEINFNIYKMFHVHLSSDEIEQMYKFAHPNLFTNSEIHQLLKSRNPEKEIHNLLGYKNHFTETDLQIQIRSHQNLFKLVEKNYHLLVKESKELMKQNFMKDVPKAIQKELYGDTKRHYEKYLKDVNADLDHHIGVRDILLNSLQELETFRRRNRSTKVAFRDDIKEEKYVQQDSIAVIGKIKDKYKIIFLNIGPEKEWNIDWRQLNIWEINRRFADLKYIENFHELRKLERKYKSRNWFTTRRNGQMKKIFLYQKLKMLDAQYKQLIDYYGFEEDDHPVYELDIGDVDTPRRNTLRRSPSPRETPIESPRHLSLRTPSPRESPRRLSRRTPSPRELFDELHERSTPSPREPSPRTPSPKEITQEYRQSRNSIKISPPRRRSFFGSLSKIFRRGGNKTRKNR